MNLEPVTLQGTLVRLEPLSERHFDDLCVAGLDPELWKLTMTVIRTPDELRAYLNTAINGQKAGVLLPFAIIDLKTKKAVGSTRFANIDHANRRLEIGWTWLARTAQRTGINTEAKLLLLTHAFEKLGCIRVEFKTDVLNTQSRTALARIGAKEEGIFRSHQIAPGGRIRDSIYFSIIDKEWANVKAHLQGLLKR